MKIFMYILVIFISKTISKQILCKKDLVESYNVDSYMYP